MISVKKVSKSFSHYRQALLREQLEAWIRGKHRRGRFYALKDVSFEIALGESVAVIGNNGSGKSTLLSLVCGLSTVDSGSIDVGGRVAALLDLGSGFHFDLTGIENLRLNASLVGLSRARTHELFDAIVEFAELGDFMHDLLRTYSTGMIMRLAISVAMHLDPEVLIVDEVLAVGDPAFQRKCFDRMMEFRRTGHTLLIVSHSDATLREICSRALWLDHGNLIEDGEVNTVLDHYGERLHETV